MCHFGGQYDGLANILQGLAHNFLGPSVNICISSIEEVDASIHRTFYYVYRLFFLHLTPVGHGAKANPGNFDPRLP